MGSLQTCRVPNPHEDLALAQQDQIYLDVALASHPCLSEPFLLCLWWAVTTTKKEKKKNHGKKSEQRDVKIRASEKQITEREKAEAN